MRGYALFFLTLACWSLVCQSWLCTVVGEYYQHHSKARRPAQHAASEAARCSLGGFEEVGVALELIGILASAVVASACAARYAAGALDHIEQVLAERDHVEARHLHRFFATDHHVHLRSGKLNTGVQGLQNGLALLDGWVHADSLVVVAFIRHQPERLLGAGGPRGGC